MTNDTKPVGVLTIPRYYNYGTQLQAFALKESIRALGYKVQVIDYSCPIPRALGLTKRLSRILYNPGLFIQGLKRRADERHLAKISSKRYSLMKEFCETQLELTKERYIGPDSLTNCGKLFSALVVGSDQVWNPMGHLGENSFFLPFVAESKRIAYAPSIGVASVTGPAKEWLADGVKGIPFLSVREKTGATVIKEICGRDANVVVDPTMLLSSEQWTAFISECGENMPYLLCYFLHGNSFARHVALEIAKKRNLKIVVFPFAQSDILSGWEKGNWEVAVSPFDFVRFIQNAAFVCTDSFHGTLFSTLFQREFFSFERMDEAGAVSFSRIEDFLSGLGIENRIVRNGQWPLLSLSSGFGTAEKVLAEWRNRSIGFLQEALQKAV